MKAFFYFPTFLENWVRTICQGRQQTHCRRTITTSLFSACKQSKALTFYPVEPIYKASYKTCQLFCFRKQCSNVSTTPITAMGYRQCLTLSVVQLKGKHCRKPHCRNGVVDTFGQCLQNKAFEKLYIKAQLDRKIRL